MMLQGVAINFVAFARFHGNLHGQVFVLFIVAVAACEAGIALAMILMLYRRERSLDASDWQSLREMGVPPTVDAEPLPPPTGSKKPTHAARRPVSPGSQRGGGRPCLTPSACALAHPRPAARLPRYWRPLLLAIAAQDCANWPLIVACATAAVLALLLLGKVIDSTEGQLSSRAASRGSPPGSSRSNFTITVDPLSAIMLAMITFISTWIAIFSTGYMTRAIRAMAASSP